MYAYTGTKRDKKIFTFLSLSSLLKCKNNNFANNCNQY